MFESNFHLGREPLRWERLFFCIVLLAVPAILSSCGAAASTTATPTISVSCTPTDVTVLATSQCTASVSNLSSTLVNWSVNGGTTNGNIDSGGLYTAPTSIPTNNVVTITATSQVQASLTATQSLTLVQPTMIQSVTCDDSSGAPATTVLSAETLSCTATASTGATVPVNWSVSNANNLGGNIGSVSATGIYTAPLVPPPGQQVNITATSQALATEMVTVKATVQFGIRVLSGPYVFSTSGRLPTNPSLFWARAGRFTAGGGTIAGGIEDTNQGGTPNIVKQQRTFTGSYSIGTDGRGTMQFCEDTTSSCPQGTPGTANFRIVVVSPIEVQIIEFSPLTPPSAAIVAGGEMISQAPVASPPSQNLFGTYSFNFSGVSTSATEESVAGDFVADGFGHIAAGGASAPGETYTTPSIATQPVPLAATTYSLNANGQGNMTLGGLAFSFYPISSSRAKFIEVDTASSGTPTTPASILVGDAFKQQVSSTCGWGLNALSGATVFETSGTSSGVVIGDVGSFTALNGAISAGSLDENSGGTVPPPQIGTLIGSYTMDPCGRGAMSLGTHSYVFYIISPSDAVLQEITTGTVAHGLLSPSQGSSFTDSTLTGSYAFRLAGTNAPGAAGNREDLSGQFTSSGIGTGLAGSLDLNDFGTTQTGVPIANGTYQTPSSLRTTMALPLTTTPSVTRNLVLYMVSPTLFYVLETDPTGTAIGLINNQF